MTDKDFRDYTFYDWLNLDRQIKTKIINQYWTPYEKEHGAFTQNEIVNAFKKKFDKISNNILATGFDYFGWDVACIYIIVTDSKIKLPKDFGDIFVNKGTIQKKLDNDTYVIKWRYGGSKNIYQINNGSISKFLGLYNWRQRIKE